MVSGPLTTVITGSEIYPWGTTEQYPNADANEGHFYMECSNKGICDRRVGICDCFDGYEGTACTRASCFNDCSGHGTCETIKEFAEAKGWDTNSEHAPTTTPVGASPSGVSGHHDFDPGIEESYAYDLWDQDKTMGCKCDSGFYGADCSLKKCKYGVDPLFYDDTDGRIYQTTVIHLGSRGKRVIGKISGTFSIVFYDVFGESYFTKPIQADPAETSALKVQEALEALPNGVIARTHGDVTFEASGVGSTKTPSVLVSKQGVTGTLTTAGCIGAGTAYTAATPIGLGLGVLGHGTYERTITDEPYTQTIHEPFQGKEQTQYGPEFTITFVTNPGILKTIELDTRQVTNPSTTDYWVASIRQGEFATRYSSNLGRVNALRYGSKLLYTNIDLTAAVTTSTPLKVGGQEFGVAADPLDYVITLNEPFLGASIIPVLTDTGSKATSLAEAALDMITSAAGKITSLTVGEFKTGAKLYVNGCPITSADSTITPDDHQIVIGTNNDCHYDAFGNGAAGLVVYRRTDDPNNQNVYATSADTAKELAQGYCTKRGSPDIYPCEQTDVKPTGFIKATNSFTFEEDVGIGGLLDVDDTIFMNGLGPMRVTAYTTGGDVFTATADTSYMGEEHDYESASHYFHSFNSEYVATKWRTYRAVATTDLAAGDIILMDGRRYKVGSVGDTESGIVNAKVTLTEAYAGGMILEDCQGCVTDSFMTSITINTWTTTRTISRTDGEGLMIQGYTNINLIFSAMTTAIGPAADTTVYVSAGAKSGWPLDMYRFTGQSLNLYKVLNGMGYKPYEITEKASGQTYQYVSQCSNRGNCDDTRGLCYCYKGYTNDNCDTQNAHSA
jgi:hypothetical protein